MHQADTLSRFIQAHYHYAFKPNKFRQSPLCDNHAAFDLGYKYNNTRDDYIENMVKEVDKNFDLVMMMDRWYESMIFLKEDLNLSFDEVVTFNINAVNLRYQYIDVPLPRKKYTSMPPKSKQEAKKLKFFKIF